jgi:hypothetical protein
VRRRGGTDSAIGTRLLAEVCREASSLLGSAGLTGGDADAQSVGFCSAGEWPAGGEGDAGGRLKMHRFAGISGVFPPSVLRGLQRYLSAAGVGGFGESGAGKGGRGGGMGPGKFAWLLGSWLGGMASRLTGVSMMLTNASVHHYSNGAGMARGGGGADSASGGVLKGCVRVDGSPDGPETSILFESRAELAGVAM